MEEQSAMSYELFVQHATDFVTCSNHLDDEWRVHQNKTNDNSLYIKKETFIESNHSLLKAEYVISYNPSYGVPMFAFNLWNSSGVLLTLDDIRNMAVLRIPREDFYSMVTQQEHPLFFRPYFTIHPCHTAEILCAANNSKNLIVTFLSIVSPIVRLSVPLEYGKIDDS